MASTSTDPDHLDNQTIKFEYVICDMEEGVACNTEIGDFPIDIKTEDTNDENEAMMVDEATQTSNNYVQTQTLNHNVQTQTPNDNFQEPLMSYNILKLNGGLEHFTGLSQKCFEVVFTQIEKSPHKTIDCCLSERDQLLITLMKNKRNFETADFGILFRVEKNLIFEIMKTWTDTLYSGFKGTDGWSINKPTREHFHTTMLACLDIPLENPEYQEYKQMKSLIAMDEAGCIIFISDIYSADIEERELVEITGILEKLNPGDCVLADESFDIAYLMEEKKVLLNWPPIYRNKDKLTGKEIKKGDDLIKQNQLTVKEVIKAVREFKIITDIVQPHMWPMLNKIHFICLSLVNLKESCR